MPLSREEILDLALRYITPTEAGDFPMKDEMFCFLQRDIPENRVLQDHEDWAFSGYGICRGYEYDMESKPRGKWLWFSFMSLETFPPSEQHIRLQPPHVVRGRFQTPARDGEIRILKIDLKAGLVTDAGMERPDTAGDEVPAPKKGEILSFPGKK